MQGEKAPNKLKVLISSYAICAALLLLSIDLGGRLLTQYAPQVLSLSPFKAANRSWVWWNVRDFNELKSAPDIVLLGSSLMMAPLHGGDAAHLNLPQNVAFHHHSQLLEDLLKEKFGRTYRTFAFALGGEMVSDAYVIAHTLLKDDRKPKVIIYGIAPRDFMDSALPSASSTEIFKYMDRVGDLSEIDKESAGSPWEQGEKRLSKVSFTYRHRPDFLYVQHRWAKELFRKLLGYEELDQVRSPLHVRKQAFLELPEDFGPTSLFVTPPPVIAEPYKANLEEYKFRYRKLNLKQFNSQLAFLERLLAMAEDDDTRVVIINMPLTTDNVALMPAGFYQSYLEQVNGIVKKHQALFLDLNDPTLFPQKYFTDSVHLNGRGGQHFFEVLADRLKQDQQTAAVIEKAGNTK